MATHSIRLRGSWEHDTPDSYRRRFGKPQRLDPHESVWLIITDMAPPIGVCLNGSDLGTFPSATCEIEITARLLPRNELVLSTSNWGGEVKLEIRSSE